MAATSWETRNGRYWITDRGRTALERSRTMSTHPWDELFDDPEDVPDDDDVEDLDDDDDPDE